MIHENRIQFDYDKYMNEKYYHVETKDGNKVEIIPRLLSGVESCVIAIVKSKYAIYESVLTYKKDGSFYLEASHGTSRNDLYMIPYTDEELGEIYADMVADSAITIAKDQITE